MQMKSQGIWLFDFAAYCKFLADKLSALEMDQYQGQIVPDLSR